MRDSHEMKLVGGEMRSVYTDSCDGTHYYLFDGGRIYLKTTLPQTEWDELTTEQQRDARASGIRPRVDSR